MPSLPIPPQIISARSENVTDQQPIESIIFHAAVVSIMSVAVSVRIYTRWFIKQNCGIDDYLIVLSWVLSLTVSRTMLEGSKYGLQPSVFESREDTLNLMTISVLLYIPLTLSVKLSILTGYNRIFKIDILTKWLIWSGVFVVSVFYTITLFYNVFICRPFGKARYLNLQGTCDRYTAFATTVRIFNITSDFYILLIPVPIVIRLTALSLARRLRIILVFGLGLFTCICSIILFVETRRYPLTMENGYASTVVMYWIILEVNVGIFCACAPVFNAFFDVDTPRSFGHFVRGLLSKSK